MLRPSCGRRSRAFRAPMRSTVGLRVRTSVASIVLGRENKRHLTAIYGYARLVDQIGDAVAGDRLAALDAFEADLARIFAGADPVHPVPHAGSPRPCMSSTFRAGRSIG